MNLTPGEHPERRGAAPGGGERKAFVFYSNWYDDVVDSLTEDQQQEFLVLIVRYATHGVEPSERATPIVRSMFGLIRPAIDADLKKYDRICETNRRRAAANAEKRRNRAEAKSTAPIVDNETLTPVAPIINNQESTSNNQQSTITTEEKSKAKAERDTRGEDGLTVKAEGPAKAEGPTWEEVEDYWRERRFRSSAQEFYRYYTERGWLSTKREPIRRWRIAANFWEEHYETHVAPMRRREAEERRQALKTINERTAQQERDRQRDDRDAEERQRQARAVSPELAKHMHQRAVALAGNDDAAMTLLRRASEDENVRKQLQEGYYR